MAVVQYLNARTNLISAPAPTIGANYEGQLFNFSVPVGTYFKDTAQNDFLFFNNIHLTGFKVQIPLLRGAGVVDNGLVQLGLSSAPLKYDLNPIGVIDDTFFPIDVLVKSNGVGTFLSLEQCSLRIDLRNQQTIYNAISVRCWVTLAYTQST